MVKNYLKCYGYLISIMIIMTIILSIVSYSFGMTGGIIKIIIPFISLLLASIVLGRYAKEKAYIHGIKFSVIYILFMTIFKLLIKTSFNYKVIIVYVLLIMTGVSGAMIGINMKKK